MLRNGNTRRALALRVVLGTAVLVGAVAFLANDLLSQDKSGAGAAEKKPPAPEPKKPSGPDEKRPPAEGEKKPPVDGEKKPSAEGAKPSAEEEAEMMRMMKEMEELASPNENHKFLESLVGGWDVVMKSWMEGPDKPASESKGTSQVKSILGGRYIVEETNFEMTMPNPATGKEEKMTFQGQGLTGYDNYRNLYVGTWVDSMSTQLLVFHGNRDQSGKVLTCYGEMDEPMLNVHGRTVKYVTRIIDKDKHTFEMYDLYAGDNFKVMELTYTRKK